MTIQFLFDYISPYAYLAWTQIEALAARHDRVVEPVPVLFAAMLNAHGQLGPAEIPNKRRYLFKDVLRSAHVLDVPLEPPPTHPFNPLLALRVTCALARATGDADPIGPKLTAQRSQQCAALLSKLISELFRATWGGGDGVESPATVASAIAAAGLDADDLLERAKAPAIKRALRDNTERAIAAGAFGVPTMLVEGELFWGYDSFSHLERFLTTGEAELDASKLERWANIQPSATRRRDATT